MPTADPAVVAQDLTRRFGPLTAVDQLGFAVAPGELFGLVGPDGAGKTTTLRMLAGVLRPSAGDALLGGVSVVRDPERVKAGIAYMPQRFGLYADLTVQENLDFYAELYEVPHAERTARLARLYAFSDLGPFRDRLAGQLSGGMKQKLGLSCALIHQPDILLLDEPTFGVDPISRRDLWLIVHEMVAAGVTVIVSTSYLDEAERFDRVALLHRGRVLALDAPETLEGQAAGTLLSLHTDQPHAARALVATLPGIRRVARFGDRLHVSVPDAGAAVVPVRQALAAAGITVHDLHPIASGLEDVFIDRVEAGAA